MYKFKQIIMVGLISLISFNAQAFPTISGAINMGGGASLLDGKGNVTNDPSSAATVDFISERFRVVAADGAFAGLSGSLGGIQDLLFDPFVAPVANFWNVGGFSYTLNNVTRGFTNDPTSFLVLNGTGIISAAGFEDTEASWNFASSTTGNGAFSWSAVSTATSVDVPEPGVLVLLSVGLIGFALRKKFKKY